MKKGKALGIALAVLLFLGGIFYALYPVIAGRYLSYVYTKQAEHFLQTSEELAATPKPDNALIWEAKDRPYAELFDAMQAYNEAIFADQQAGLCDAWAYQEPCFDLAAYGIEEGVFGVVSIPAMEVELPIYLGATNENMAKGAVHLSQTSLPLGETNSNCVLAAHRGWYDAPYFRYIEKLQIGDTVTVTTLWQTLTYTVSEIKVIEPNDIDQILIQPGRELLTLLTCHPYASGGRYRYVVYCERTTE